MGWRQWTTVAVVVGGGVLLQIPAHDHAEMDHGATGHPELSAGMAATQGSVRTVALDVTGMT